MAFVFRGQRKTDLSRPRAPVGPGSYEHQIHVQNKIPKAYVPFGSMEVRSKDTQYKEAALPGPGTYNISDNNTGQKIVVSSQTEDIKILEISRPTPVFKSGTQRFAEIKQQEIGPGPGQYVVKNGIVGRPKMLSTGMDSNKKPRIIEHLININKYQSIPSIPSNIHAFGYNQNENNQLELNEPPIQVYKGQKSDVIGPGHYNPEAKERTRGTSQWSKAKEKRFQETRTNINIGPGAYDVKNVQSLYTYKPSAGFASKTLRSMDQRKGALLNEQQQTKRPIAKIVEDNNSVQSSMESRVYSQKAPPSTKIDEDSDSDEYQYIDDTTPGPGSYLEISEVKKFNKPARPAVPSFGVGTKRFVKSTHANNAEIGPGSYNPKYNFEKKIRKNKEKVPPKDADRFPELVNKKKVQEPGPGNYEPRNTMEDKLIYKIQRGYRGQFGSTEVRSKDPQDDELPGPADYDPKQYEQQKEPHAIFKSVTNRKGITDPNSNPAPGVYNINQYDIENKIIKEEEDDPDLIIKKPGFGVGQKRFKDAPRRDQEFDDDDIIKQIQQKYRQQKKRKQLKPSAPFKNNQNRFKDVKKQIPGPGTYYDGEDDHWNKRTYNILFADI